MRMCEAAPADFSAVRAGRCVGRLGFGRFSLRVVALSGVAAVALLLGWGLA